MSMPFRQADGTMLRIAYDDEGLSKLSKINYFYLTYDEVEEENEEIIKGYDELFKLKKENIEKIFENSLFPTYYLNNFDLNEIYKEPIDFVAFSNSEIDSDILEFNIDLQLYNNIIFMIANSEQMSTFFRNVWDKVMLCYEKLVDNEYLLLKRILINRYLYNEEMAEKYCKNLDEYIYYFYKMKIYNSMKYEVCYDAFVYYKELISSSVPKKIYVDLNEKFNQFILETLDQKVDEMLRSGYCKDVFYQDFFAERILKLSDLNKYKVAEVIDNIYYYYKSCIEVRIENKAYHDAERCYNIVNKYRNLFDYKQIDELDKLKKIIDENYKEDPYVKEMRKKEILFKINEFLIPALVCVILIGIISLIACFITGFKNTIWDGIFIGSVVSFLLGMILDKFTR